MKSTALKRLEETNWLKPYHTGMAAVKLCCYLTARAVGTNVGINVGTE